MQLNKKTADIFIPDGTPEEEALTRTTHMGIGAHQDDLEIIAYHGILECFETSDSWFSGVTCTNGSGSARTGVYAEYSDKQMQEVRRQEQREASLIGRYSSMIQLDYPSSEIKTKNRDELVADLKKLLLSMRPSVIYTHNLADKHLTHIAVVLAVLEALREIATEYQPEQVLGVEAWRNLDWMSDSEKVLLDVEGKADLAKSLMEVFDSQIAGGKQYYLAAVGRRQANATFFQSHSVDESSQINYAMDLTPLIKDCSIDIVDYTMEYLDHFSKSVSETLKNLSK
jgi:LmbE family N-acetylglucosaminyl deacetylase